MILRLKHTHLLPDSPTDGIKISASGSVDVKDDTGATVLALDLDITIQ